MKNFQYKYDTEMKCGECGKERLCAYDTRTNNHFCRECNIANGHDLKKDLKEGDTITVIGRRWFERINGNTYHSVVIYVNGDMLERLDFEYGYGSMYMQNAAAILDKYYNTGLPEHSKTLLWKLKDRGIKLIDSVTDVKRKKDL